MNKSLSLLISERLVRPTGRTQVQPVEKYSESMPDPAFLMKIGSYMHSNRPIRPSPNELLASSRRSI